MRDTSLDDEIATVIKRLAKVVDLPLLQLEAEVRSCFASWDDAKVREFVPIFVERAVRERLGLRSEDTAVA